MALKRYQETFGSVQAGGDVFVLAGASVEVRDETSGALAAIFDDRAGNTAKANPFTTDSNGYGFFYAADGRYRVKATLSGETVDIRDVLLGVGATTVTTSTGEQTVIDAFDARATKAFLPINIRDHGAVGDGVTDDTAAIQAALDSITTSGATVYFPAGNYLVTAKLTLTDKPIRILGDGMFVSKITWDGSATSDGILLTQTSDAYIVAVESIALLTEKDAVGTALQVDMSGQQSGGVVQDRTQPRVVIRDVAAEGVTGPSVDGFNIGLHFIDVMHPVVDGFHFTGNWDGVTPGTVDSGPAMRLETTGSAAEAFLTNCWAFHASHGLEVIGYEGVVLQNYNFVAVTQGVTYSAAGDEPQINVLDGHVNARVRCVNFTNAVRGVIKGNLFFLRSDAPSNGVGARLENCDQYEVTGNTFRNNSGNTFDDIFLTGTTEECHIGTNIHSVATTAINIGANALRNKIDRQVYGTVANKIIDAGTNNLRASASAVVNRSTNQGIPNTTDSVVAFNSEVHDDSQWHDNSTNNSRLTVPPGVERVVLSSSITFASNSTGNRSVRLLKNGVAFNGSPQQSHPGSGGEHLNISSGVLPVQQGDYFEVEVFQSSGGALDIVSDTSTWFAIHAVE